MSTQSVSYFLSSQDWRTDAPEEVISTEEARRRKRDGDYFVNGNTMIQAPPIVTEKTFEGWRVVDQTGKAGIRHKATRIGPGCPRYALV